MSVFIRLLRFLLSAGVALWGAWLALLAMATGNASDALVPFFWCSLIGALILPPTD